jgi:hypothetical protein
VIFYQSIKIPMQKTLRFILSDTGRSRFWYRGIGSYSNEMHFVLNQLIERTNAFHDSKTLE